MNIYSTSGHVVDFQDMLTLSAPTTPTEPISLVAQRVLEETKEQLTQQVIELSIQDEITIRKHIVQEKTNNLMLEFRVNINTYHNIPIHVRVCIMELAEIKHKLVNVNDSIELDNLMPSSLLMKELNNMMNSNPFLKTAIKTHNVTTREIIEILKETRKMAINGNIVAQHFTRMFFRALSINLDSNDNSMAIYIHIIRDLKTSKK